MNEPGNVDAATVVGFGDEWSAFDETAFAEAERDEPLWCPVATRGAR